MSTRYNILLLVADQERYFDEFPFPMPGRDRLRALGVTFEQHQIAANVCSPSRSVIYTGQHIQNTGVYDNVNAPWQASMSTEIPNLGTMMREAGYYTAYKGKFHLAAELETVNDLDSPTTLLTEVLEEYGFSDYYNVGDIIGSTWGGYLHDELIAAMTVNWLRAKGRPMHDEGQPWFLAVNLVNPHDAMYVNTDAPGEPVQAAYDPVMDIAPPPDTPMYRESWDVPLAESRHEAFDAPGRPQAHYEFQEGRAVLLGTWPDEDRRWKLLQDYYFNCIRDSDRHIARVLDELETQGLLDDTIIVMTSDHGELAGAHQMHGKGPCAYREQNHVPLIIAHPEFAGGQRCGALTSHVDVAPTVLDLAGASTDALVGHSLTPLLDDPAGAALHALRDDVLFSFNMLSYLDSAFLEQLKATQDAKGLARVKEAIGIARAVKPALEKRGALRSLFDGRYRFTRYFSPLQHHVPETLEQLYAHNDLELFDLERDPHEQDNLARDPEAHEELIRALNARLNRRIADEVGVDDGSSLALSKFISWDLSSVDI